MDRYARSHLADQTLLRSAETNAGRERSSMADLLADVAEIDVRKLYLPAAHPSMYAYCVGELHLSEDAAFKRITAARAARRFPAVFDALAEGRLHLSAVVLLAPHLTEDTAAELLAAATHKSKTEIERLLAERFPRADMLAWVEAIPAASAPRSAEQHAARHVEDQLAPGRVDEAPHAPAHASDRSRVQPLSPQSFGVQFTLSQSAHDKLRHVQELLSHQIPSGDLALVFERALDALAVQLEQRKLAATSHPRRGHRRSPAPGRHIPAEVRRAVWERDGGQCTFVSDSGHRCQARKHIEFDHIEAVARGGEATVAGMRLLCRAHNQYAAECTFGAEFMRHKRIAAAEERAAAKARTKAVVRTTSTVHAQAATSEPARMGTAAAAQPPVRTATAVPAPEDAEDRDVVPWLRALGFSAGEARRAAARCEDIPDASLEQRVRVALSCIGVRGTRIPARE